MANIKITDLTAYGDPTSTDVLPIVDVGADVTKKVSIADLLENAGSGTEALPGIAFDGDPDTGIYRPGEDRLALSTNGTGRLFIDSAGLVGIGTSSPEALFHTVNTSAGAATLGAVIQNNSSTANTEVRLGFSPNSSAISDNRYAYIGSINVLGSTDNSLTFGTGLGAPATERMRIDSSGRVGIGTTGPSDLIHGRSSGDAKLFLQNTSGNDTGITLQNDGQGSAGLLYDRSANTVKLYGPNVDITYANATQSIVFNRGVNESARIDSSGRLLVGTSSALAVGNSQHIIQTESTGTSAPHGASFVRHNGTIGPAGAVVSIARTRGASPGAVTAVANGDTLGYIIFSGANGTDVSNNAAWIRCDVDGEPFSSGDTTDLPGRLIFSTTADGASTPTERMRIKSNGTINFSNVSVYADNAAAKTGGLVDGDVYRTSTGDLKIVYT